MRHYLWATAGSAPWFSARLPRSASSSTKRRCGAAGPTIPAGTVAPAGPGGVKLPLVLIPPGMFLMGSSEEEQTRFLEHAKAANDKNAVDRIPNEGPQHLVRISRPFYLGKHEMTQAQWESVMGNHPSEFKDPANPVDRVSFDEIQTLLKKLNTFGRAMAGNAELAASDAEVTAAEAAG